APAELECAEVRAHRAGHGRAADRAVEDPIVRLAPALRGDGEIDRRAVERAVADVAGSSVAGERAGDLSVFDVKGGGDAHVAGRALHGDAPRSVDRRGAGGGRRRTELHFASVDEDLGDLRLLVEDRLVADHDVGDLPLLQRSELPVDAENARGTER